MKECNVIFKKKTKETPREVNKRNTVGKITFNACFCFQIEVNFKNITTTRDTKLEKNQRKGKEKGRKERGKESECIGKNV